jgi:hypothetical protein
VAPGQAEAQENQERQLEFGAHGTPGDATQKGISRGWLLIAPAAPTPTGGVPAVLPLSPPVTLLLSGIPAACAGRELASLLFMGLWLSGGRVAPRLRKSEGCRAAWIQEDH